MFRLLAVTIYRVYKTYIALLHSLLFMNCKMCNAKCHYNINV